MSKPKPKISEEKVLQKAHEWHVGLCEVEKLPAILTQFEALGLDIFAVNPVAGVFGVQVVVVAKKEVKS